jgi:AraC-like DNA-binding protein
VLVPPAEEGAPTTDAEETRRAFPDAISPQELRRLVDHHLALEECPPGPLAAPEAPLPETIEAVVSARLGDPDFTVGTLAEAVDISRRQLTRRMKDTFDDTPAAYIRARRIERAEKLLADGPETIAGVAAAVGFASPSAFSKAFREATGCSPSTYAERHAG